MRKWAFILVVIAASLQSCISVRVNSTVDSADYYKNVSNPNIRVQGTFFENGSNDSKWSNTNGNNWTRATFENSNVASYIKFQTTKKISVKFQSDLNLSGDLRFEIIDEDQNVLFSKEVSQSNSENFRIDFPKAGKYQIRWKMKNATGNYSLEWKQE